MWRRAVSGCMGASCCRGEVYDESNIAINGAHAEGQDLLPNIKDDHFIQTSISDAPLWKNNSEKACPKRSDVIDGILQNQRADYLGVVLEHGWDVNEMLQVYVSGKGRVQRTALHHAVYYGWREGVRLLLNAGADCTIKCQWCGVADLLVPRYIACQIDYHFKSFDMKHTPMCAAIYKDDLEMVKLLLQNGLHLEDRGCDYLAVNLDQLRLCSLYDCTEIERKQNDEVLDELLINGQKVRRNLDEQLQYLLQEYIILSHSQNTFIPEHLDVLFTHGVHIEPEYKGSTLSNAFKRGQTSVNTARWFIRHGASCTSSLYYFLRYIGSYRVYFTIYVQCYTLPMLELLLQIGMHHSNTLKEHLGELRLLIQEHLNEEKPADSPHDLVEKTTNIYRNILSGEKQLADEKLDQKKRGQPFPTDKDQQMAHLREFSDDSLNVYPEELYRATESEQERWDQTVKRISDMLHFLNQPHTLQWYCRVSLRQSLVSLSPSVMKTLSVPAALKRYILCHEL